MKNFYLIAFAIFILTSCNSTKKLKEFSNNDLIFGSGGGITGMTNEYVLHYEGAIEKINSLTKEVSQLKSISEKESKSLFQEYLKNGFDTLDYSVPGNMSYFIGFKNDSLTKKITWGGDGEPPLKVKDFYNNLNQLISNQ